MGCLVSKISDINDIYSDVFSVCNMDDGNNEVKEGHLEITDQEVIFYQDNKEELVSWPLHSLRRYGARADTFSFESGRKCQTGPGIHVFKCDRSDRILTKLTEKVGGDATNVPLGFVGDQEAPPLPGGHRADLLRQRPDPNKEGSRIPPSLTPPKMHPGGSEYDKDVDEEQPISIPRGLQMPAEQETCLNYIEVEHTRSLDSSPRLARSNPRGTRNGRPGHAGKYSTIDIVKTEGLTKTLQQSENTLNARVRYKSRGSRDHSMGSVVGKTRRLF